MQLLFFFSAFYFFFSPIVECNIAHLMCAPRIVVPQRVAIRRSWRTAAAATVFGPCACHTRARGARSTSPRAGSASGRSATVAPATEMKCWTWRCPPRRRPPWRRPPPLPPPEPSPHGFTSAGKCLVSLLHHSGGTADLLSVLTRLTHMTSFLLPSLVPSHASL